MSRRKTFLIGLRRLCILAVLGDHVFSIPRRQDIFEREIRVYALIFFPARAYYGSIGTAGPEHHGYACTDSYDLL